MKDNIVKYLLPVFCLAFCSVVIADIGLFHPNCMITNTANNSGLVVSASIGGIFYELGDSINIEVEIRNLSNNSIFVLDSKCFGKVNIACDIKRSRVDVQLNGALDSSGESIRKLKILTPGQFERYNLFSVVDSSVNPVIPYYAYFLVNYWVFSSELEYLALGDCDGSKLKSSKDKDMFKKNEIPLNLGRIELFTRESYEGIIRDY